MEDPRDMASHTAGGEHAECLFCHLKAVRTLVRKNLERHNLGHCVEDNFEFDIATGGIHNVHGINNYWCITSLSLGLGIVQPLVSVISLGEGLCVDVVGIATAIGAETVKLHARREQLAAAMERIRQTAFSVIAEAASEGVRMDLLSIDLMGYVPELGPQDVKDVFRVEILMLTEVRGQVEMDRVTIHTADAISFADHLREMLPAQRVLRRKLPGSIGSA